MGLPVGLALNFVINNNSVVIPMVVEEPSVVAAVSGAAKTISAAGGFTATSSERNIIFSQVQLVDVPDMERAIENVRIFLFCFVFSYSCVFEAALNESQQNLTFYLKPLFAYANVVEKLPTTNYRYCQFIRSQHVPTRWRCPWNDHPYPFSPFPETPFTPQRSLPDP
jgi:hypothetical protein